MACGENPKRVYGSKGQFPSTRMGNVAGYRQAFADAQDYRKQWDKYERELRRLREEAEPATPAKDEERTATRKTHHRAAQARSEARNAGRRAQGRHPRAHALLSFR